MRRKEDETWGDTVCYWMAMAVVGLGVPGLLLLVVRIGWTHVEAKRLAAEYSASEQGVVGYANEDTVSEDMDTEQIQQRVAVFKTQTGEWRPVDGDAIIGQYDPELREWDLTLAHLAEPGRTVWVLDPDGTVWDGEVTE